MSPTKLTGRENLRKYAFWLGPIRSTDKEIRVKMLKMYCFRYITSLKWQESRSESNSRNQIRIELKSRTRIRIKVKSRVQIQIPIKRVWIRNTSFRVGKYGFRQSTWTWELRITSKWLTTLIESA
jgi:hypothetical protein